MEKSQFLKAFGLSVLVIDDLISFLKIIAGGIFAWHLYGLFTALKASSKILKSSDNDGGSVYNELASVYGTTLNEALLMVLLMMLMLDGLYIMLLIHRWSLNSSFLSNVLESKDVQTPTKSCDTCFKSWFLIFFLTVIPILGLVDANNWSAKSVIAFFSVVWDGFCAVVLAAYKIYLKKYVNIEQPESKDLKAV